jgi:hypothetical protein
MVLSLKDYGTSFLDQLFFLLLTDHNFFIGVHQILDPEYFVDEAYKALYKVILMHFEKYHSVPSFEIVQTYFANFKKDAVKQHMTNMVLEIERNECGETAYIRDKTIEFCRHQALKKHMLIASRELKVGNYDQVESILMDALKKIDIEHNLDHDY